MGSNDQNYTIDQIGELILQFVPEAHIVKLGEDVDKRNYWVNFNKLSNALGYRPDWSIERGIKQVLDALKSGTLDDYRSAQYSNVKFLTEEGIYRLAKTENGMAYELLNGDSSGNSVLLKI